MEFGFIGFGSMAQMLIHCFVDYAGVDPHSICVTRKNAEKLCEIRDMFPGVSVYSENTDLATNARVVFLCMRPSEVKDTLTEIAPVLDMGVHIISLAGTVSMDNLQTIFPGKISKLVPTLTSQVGEGISLICHNECVTDEDAKYIEDILKKFGNVKRISDNERGFATTLTSCAPGFIASIFNEYTKAAIRHNTSFNKDEVAEMVVQTLYATAKLLVETDMSFSQAVSRVATKGGITQEGVDVIERSAAGMFDKMFEKSLEKTHITEETINNTFN